MNPRCQKRLAAAAMVIALALASALSACLFDARDAHDPATGAEPIPTPDPRSVFVALRESLEKQTDANYERAVSARYAFSPLLDDSLHPTFDGTGAFDNWTKDVELDVLGLLLSDASSIEVDFGTPSIQIDKTDFVRFRVTYVLDVVEQATSDTTSYQGVAEFDVKNEGGNWRLTFWNEVEPVSGHTTWGFLKGILRLRLNP